MSPRRTMAERKQRAAERTTRRDSLLVLLSRIQRAVPITPAEAALLRAHVELELADADELRRTVRGQQTAIQRQARRIDAAETAIREAEQRAEQAEAVAAEAKRLLERRTTTLRTRAEYAEQQLADTREKRNRWAAEADALLLAAHRRADRYHAAWRSARARARKFKPQAADNQH
ncbi:hypothetical protein AB0E11_27865 [Streptomyces fradiae]|uniref:hypothetical protein n=1 Tax=Streptomyces fradiae TaxID=1906 RepID=UPI0033E9A936